MFVDIADPMPANDAPRHAQPVARRCPIQAEANEWRRLGGRGGARTGPQARSRAALAFSLLYTAVYYCTGSVVSRRDPCTGTVITTTYVVSRPLCLSDGWK